MGGAVAPGGLQLDYYLPGIVDLYALIGQGRSGDVAAQPFQALALLGLSAHRRVQSETLFVGTRASA